MKPASILFAALLASRVAIGARADEPAEIPLWTGEAPGSEGMTDPELVVRSASGERSVSRIHHPTLTPYPAAAGTSLGVAVIVMPGGGHRVLAIDHEGYNVAQRLSERGVSAFVLKYRLARDTNASYQVAVHALADAHRAIRLVRSRAAEWGIDPARVGVLGFSAGGELAAMASLRYEAGAPRAADPMDRLDCRPAFQALIYPGGAGNILPTRESPPAFLACAYDDRPDIGEGLASVYIRFRQAGVPAELHIYGSGGHGFGVRASNHRPVGAWLDRFCDWLGDAGFARKP